ncbi:MAG: hypothetical protein WCY88_14300 [Spongiibacteraceae bacterium]|jgi:hypothetical protein
MTRAKATTNNIAKLLTCIAVSIIIGSTGSIAEELIGLSKLKTIKSLEFKRLKVNNMQLYQETYTRYTKVTGKYRGNFVADKSSYSWGISQRGISILKRF